MREDSRQDRVHETRPSDLYGVTLVSGFRGTIALLPSGYHGPAIQDVVTLSIPFGD